jgi:hypothetical protein
VWHGESQAGGRLQFATAYFNLPSALEKQISASSASVDLLTASPQAHGWHGASGAAKVAKIEKNEY